MTLTELPPQPTSTSETDTPGTALPVERDCLIFIPGMSSHSLDQTISGIAERIATVFRTNAKDETAEFYTKIEVAPDVNECSGEVGTVYRKDSSGSRPIVDIYKFEYRNTLVDRFEKRNLFVKATLLLAALPGSTLRVLRALFSSRSGKTRAEIFQLLYALGILSSLVIYVGILLLALWKSAAELNLIPDPTVATRFLNDFRPEGFPNWDLGKVSQGLVILSAAFALVVPSGITLKTLISQAAVNSLALIYYLNLGEGRTSIFGRLEVLIDDILKKMELERRNGNRAGYRNVSVMAYSFGSIIALDSFFPNGRDPARPFQRVHSLITIGCPFDFVRTMWRDYFDARRRFASGCPVRWLNVYSPEDVLGSNFRDASEVGDPNINIRGAASEESPDVPLPQKNIVYTQGLDHSRLSWLDSFTLIGLRSHGMYWGSGPPETNCFNELVPHMWDGDSVLK